nr:ADP-ribosylation factor-binding protein GGA2 [Pelodiscus sinensis]|eukprot:XP_025041788.1 ADP-ribosylation factor-binding protein GGA2 [Pelodiscus sinensis]
MFHWGFSQQFECFSDKATDPSAEENWECIRQFCAEVNADPEGPSLAPRLLAHKIQSPQEMEALHALTVLETCVNNCGERFHSEVAKFRFLNELIKVLSPKYFGTWSAEKVKSRIIEIMFSWTVWFPQEVKIRDAYQMLKKQGIIKQDPKLLEDKILPPPSPRPGDSIFDIDEEKSKRGGRFLANSGISPRWPLVSVVSKEQEKSAQVSKRLDAIGEVHSNVKLLDEMLSSYRRQELPTSDLRSGGGDELVSPLSAAEILQANDKLTQALGSYRQLVGGHAQGRSSATSSTDASAPRSPPGATKCYTLIDFSELDSRPASPPARSGNAPATAQRSSTSSCLLDKELMALGLSDSPVGQRPAPDFGSMQGERPLPAAQELSTSWALEGSAHAEPPAGQGREEAALGVSALVCVRLGWASPAPGPSWPRASSVRRAPGVLSVWQGAGHSGCPPPGVLGEHWQGGAPPRNVLQDWAGQLPPSPVTGPYLSPVQLSPAGLPSSLAAGALLPDPACELKPAAPSQPASHAAALADLFVPLTSVTPSTVPPVTVYDQNGLKAMLHFSRDPAPGRPDVLVLVLSVLSTSALPVKDVVFQAAVPKAMSIKLQPASGSELPAFSPLLPPAVISQVLLLANPHRHPVRLRHKLTFTQGGRPFCEVGEVTGFPEAELWGRR